MTELRVHVQHIGVCDGCRSLITDGVVTRHNGDDVTESYRALVARRHGWGFDQTIGHLKLCGGIPPCFSYDPCGGCGTNRAGNRHLVAIPPGLPAYPADAEAAVAAVTDRRTP